MGLFLFRFWPALLPLLIYAAWILFVRRRAISKGDVPPHFRSGPWYWAVLASLLTAAACFLWLGASMEQEKGRYIPPRIEKGILIPGHVEP